MSDLASIVPAAAALIGLLVVIAAALHGWRGWLELKRAQLEAREAPGQAGPSPTARIELADLKERVRRLEAIASGAE